MAKEAGEIIPARPWESRFVGLRWAWLDHKMFGEPHPPSLPSTLRYDAAGHCSTIPQWRAAGRTGKPRASSATMKSSKVQRYPMMFNDFGPKNKKIMKTVTCNRWRVAGRASNHQFPSFHINSQTFWIFFILPPRPPRVLAYSHPPHGRQAAGGVRGPVGERSTCGQPATAAGKSIFERN